MKNTLRHGALHGIVLAILAALYFVLPVYHSGNVARIMVFAIYAMGYNIMFGYTGLLSLGHALFFSAGMYGLGLSMHLGGVPAAVALLLGLLSALLVAAVIGFFALRTRGVAFMIVTLMSVCTDRSNHPILCCLGIFCSRLSGLCKVGCQWLW